MVVGCQAVRRFPRVARAVLIPALIICAGIEFELLYTPYLKRVHLWREVSVVLHLFRGNSRT